MLNIPLMSNNIIKEDVECLIEFLKTSDVFTQSSKVREFEQKWSEWLGVKYSVFVNSGSSANYITMAGIRELYGLGEVIVGPIGWSSDISSIITAGLTPVFVDVKKENFGIDEEELLEKITPNTKAVMLTHVLGFNALTQRLIDELESRNILLIEDACESHGTTFEGRKVGSVGYASNFSFYYAHHMSTIEGGMVCTNDERFYQYMRMFRSHGMLRESTDSSLREQYEQAYPEVHPEFLFTVCGYNMRSTELNAVIGLNQLERLDANVVKRAEHFTIFLEHLDSTKYYTDFSIEGGSNYALILLLRNPDKELFNRICGKLREENVEFRRGTAGGGNLARQPFVKKALPKLDASAFKNAEYIHEYGIYLGNYPDMQKAKIIALCDMLNNIS